MTTIGGCLLTKTFGFGVIETDGDAQGCEFDDGRHGCELGELRGKVGALDGRFDPWDAAQGGEPDDGRRGCELGKLDGQLGDELGM